MKRILLIPVLFCILAVQGYGQNIVEENLVNSGSVYTNIGVGAPADLGSSSADGMGLFGVSYYESTVPGLANPAQWGSTFFSLATGGLTLKNFDASDNFGSSQNTVLSVNQFQLQLPLKKNKLGLSLSLSPLTQSNFRVVSEENLFVQQGGVLDTLNTTTENKSDGGVNNLELGFGWKINKNISVGYAASLVFASIENQVSTRFEDLVNFQPVDFSLKTNGIGFGNRFGTMIRLPNAFKEDDRIVLGATASLPVTISGERVQESDKQISSRTIETIVLDEGEGLGDGDITIPLKLGGGITYHLNEKLAFSAETVYQQWSDFEFEFDAEQESLLKDRYKTGIGLRYFPFVDRSDKFLSKFKYRAGASYDTGHLEINGEPIETLLFSAGLGIPAPRSNSSIDLTFQYGFRGTKSQNLVKERIWGLKLSINLAELMFFRPKLQ